MSIVALSVLKSGKNWKLEIQDADGRRLLAEHEDREDIEDLAFSVMHHLETQDLVVQLNLGAWRRVRRQFISTLSPANSTGSTELHA